MRFAGTYVNVILIGKEPFWKDGSNRASGVWVQVPTFTFMGYSQAVTAMDFDSMIASSNLATPVSWRYGAMADTTCLKHVKLWVQLPLPPLCRDSPIRQRRYAKDVNVIGSNPIPGTYGDMTQSGRRTRLKPVVFRVRLPVSLLHASV